MPLAEKTPAVERLRKIDPDPSVVRALVDQGFGSALEIAQTAEPRFVKRIAAHLADDEDRAKLVHRRARQITSAVMHAFTNVHTAVRDPLFNALKVRTVGEEAQTAFDALPSYQELFGSLDYCECEECRSIFGAAAYLTDLLRVVDEYVTQPDGDFAFATRRPDIGTIPLTCASTNDTFPMLHVVNERLVALATTYLNKPPDLFQALTTTNYPFELPFHLPWTQILHYLDQIGVPLADVYAAFGAGATDIARARFDIAYPQLDFVTSPRASDTHALAVSYGVADGALAGLANAPAFLTASGLGLDDLRSLLAQGLSDAELTGGVAAGFFINGGLAGKWLSYQPGDASSHTPATIVGLAAAPNDPLDRISRFVRLAARVRWDYTTLDWALRTVGGGTATISPAAAASLGAIADLSAATGLSTTDSCALIGPLKPYGAGKGLVSTAPFDVAFNDPSVVGTDVYHPATSLNPGYGSAVRPWTPGSTDPAQQALTARLAAATSLSLGDVTALGTSLFGSAATNLTYDALCAIYRHGLLVRVLGMTVATYLTFMNRLGYVKSKQLTATLALSDVQTIVARGAWLADSGLTIDEIDYFLGANASATVDPLFQASALPDWMASIQTSTSGLSGAALDAELFRQLGVLFGTTPDVPTVLAGTAKAAADAAAPLPGGVTWEQAFTTPPARQGDPQPYLAYVTAYVTALSRWFVLARALSASTDLIGSVIAAPAAFGFGTPPDLTSVYWLSTFQQLSTLYADTAGRLIAFADPNVQTPPADPATQLAAATGWDQGQVSTLLAAYSSQTNRVLVLQALDRQFALLRKLGANPAFVAQLISVTTNDSAAWSDYQALATLVLVTIRARVRDDQWGPISVQLDGALQARQRDVLAPLVLANLRTPHPQIQTLDNLSEYLLIDVETTGVLQISRVREALNAVQLYLQRCRLQLEPITELAIPEAWWEWIANYRVWEANREVFLYPENYLDPSLRKDKTKLFADLENTLQQGEVTAESVDAAYRTYVDGLVKLASLEYVDAYRCTVNDAERGPLNTTFLFARTATDPYDYYSISYREGVWGSWQPIHVTIPAPVVTPVYAFNRLFLFWVELKVAKDAQIQNQASSQGIAYEATIKYSFTDFNEDWIQPQALVADEVVYYMPAVDKQADALGPLANRLDLFQMDSLFWQKVSVTVVEPTPGASAPDPSNEKLVVMYGPFLEKTAATTPFTEPTTPPPPLANPGSPAQQFAEQIFDITTTFDQLVGADPYGYMPLIEAIVLDHQLNPSYIRRANEVVVLESDLRENAPPLVKPEIESVLGTVALASSDCAYVANAIADAPPPVATTRPPLPVTQQSFVTGPIDSTTAATVFTQLGTKGIVNNGSVAASFSGTTDLSFLISAGVPERDIPTVRLVLLDAKGDPTLFSTIPVKTAAVIAVKNRPGSFVLSVGDEAFLLTPRDVDYDDVSLSTVTTPIESSPLVFDSYFAPISANSYTQIFNDLVGNQLVNKLGSNYGVLSPAFDARTDLSSVFSGAPPAQQAALILQLRRILLALPSLTLLTYDDNSIPRFVTPSSFVTPDINQTASQQAFTDLVGNQIINNSGYLITEVSATTDLSQILQGAPDSIREEIRAVLMQLPKFVQTSSFVTPNVNASQSQEAFTALGQHSVIDAQGAVSPSFGPATDLSFLFNEVAEPTRDVMIADVQGVLEQFYDSTYRVDSNEIVYDVERISARSSSREMSYALFAGGIDAALARDTQNAPVMAKLPFDRLGPNPANISPPPLNDGAQIDFDGPFGLYYWELFYHAPLLVASLLVANQQFEAAKKWIEYVLDPTAAEQLVGVRSFVTPDINAPTSEGAFNALVTQGVLVTVGDATHARVSPSYTPQTPLGSFFQSLPAALVDEYRAILSNYQLATPQSHYWQFRPFRTQTLDVLLATLTNATQIATYEDDPFDPDAIARLRIGAYEKATVMRYVDLLLGWGDMLFAQYTWESITSATLLYMYADDLLGPRPVDLGPCPAPASALNFNDIKAKYGSAPIPEFLIDLENSLDVIDGVSPLNPPGTPFNAIDAYFCVPSNSQLASYWDRVEDRLTKIRHGENIAGVPTPIALFDPPLDPMALVRASASGAGFLGAAAGPAATPQSNYRFNSLYDQAAELAAGVKDLGGALLAALEKRDATALDVLRNTQETAILNLTTTIKQQEIGELVTTVASLELQRDKATFTADHYNGLVSGDLSAQERLTRALDAEAIYFQTLAVPIRGIAIAGYLSPSIFGLADGGMQWGDAVNNGAEIAATISQVMSLSSALTATTGEFERRSDDWDFQAQSATRDVAIYQKQIDATNEQLAAARQDLVAHLRSIEQSNAVSQFLSSRFTNTDLYSWMVGRLAALYFQSYTAAVDAARAAELAYQFEQNASDTYVDYDYWDSLHRGLCAGENLLQSLTQLKKAYVDANNRKLEVQKTISLRQLDPTQIQSLRNGQPATFALTETMLDFDFPGQYARQIMSVSVTIPSLVGPYQNINAVLRQETSKVVTAAVPAVVDYLVSLEGGGSPNPPASGLRENWLPQQEIAVSRGTNDAGVYQLDFGGDRFMPFEGTGAISTWTLAIPPENNRIDLSQLTDVIIDVRYNALDGGSTFDGSPSFRTDVIGVLRTHNARLQGKRYLDGAQMFPSAWYAFMHPQPKPATQTLAFDLDGAMFPYAPSMRLDQVSVKIDVADTVTSTDSSNFVSLQIGAATIPLQFTGGYALATNLGAAATDFLEQWSLVVTLANSPDPHLLSAGQLDPDALLDFELVLSWSADVLPPVKHMTESQSAHRGGAS